MRKDQILGCILGGALGDAWGGPWEGNTGPIAFQIPSRSFISDDTQLTLATCESVLEKSSVQTEHIASQFAVWFATGRLRGLGSSTLKAMRDLVAGVHWALAGSGGEYSAGNGAAMRIAPLAFLLNPNNDEDRRIIRDVCRITHRNDEAYIGALAVIVAIRFVVSGDRSRAANVLAAVAEAIPDSAVRDRIKNLAPLKSPPKDVAAQFGATGWVVDTVPLALYCAQYISEKPLAAVITQAVESGGDTDTIGSITGQIAGAASGVPPDCMGHFSRIAGGDEIIRVAESFADFLDARSTPG